MAAIIEFKQVSKRFETETVLKDLTLTIEQGEIFVIVGPSGSGKTTSLKMINGLIEPTEGDIYFKDKRIKDYNLQKLRWQMGYVLQQIALFPTMSVKENIEVIPEMLGWKKERREQRVDELLREVDLDPEQYRNRMPGELSGGQQQRIGIIRALAAEPDIMLMDEPFSALDPLSRTSLQDLVLTLHEKLGNTIVFVTHNMKEALKLGDRIAVMQEGRIIQCDTPEVIQNHPKDGFVRAFFDEAAGTETLKVANLVEEGFFQAQEVGADGLGVWPQVSLRTRVPELFRILVEYPGVILTDEAGAILGAITQADVFRFLSREEK